MNEFQVTITKIKKLHENNFCTGVLSGKYVQRTLSWLVNRLFTKALATARSQVA
jgi:hypothetical protein